VGQRGRHDSSLCNNDDCRYRSLYEGTQTSLADMSAKQSSALRSLTVVKRRVSDLLKQHFPSEHARAERSLAGRLADAEDEVLMTYLEELVGGAISPLDHPMRTAPLGTDLLREALRMAGYPIGEGDDLAAWAASVNKHQARVDQHRASAGTVPTGVVGAGGVGERWEQLGDVDGELADSGSGPGDDSVGGAAALDELFGDEGADPIGDGGDGGSQLAALDELFGDEGADPIGDGGDGGSQLAALDDLFGDEEAVGGVLLASDGGGSALDELFGDDVTGSLDELFGDGSFGGYTGQGRSGDDPMGAEPVEASAAALDELFGDEVAVGGIDTGQAGGGLSVGGGRVDAAPVSAEALTIPIRPEVIPAGRARRQTRTPRRRAAGPDPRRDLDDEGVDVEVGTDVAGRIEAAVAIPRPVFSSELVGVAGSQEVLDSWMQDMYDLGARAPVRFVTAKTRHRFLGTLVLPDGDLREAAVEFDHTWWAQVMTRYHGSSLYELAVLLSRVGEQVQSSDLSDTCARFRLDTPRGLVGALVHLGGGLEVGSSGRDELASAIDQFSRERFTLMAVMNIHAGQPAMDTLVGAVREIAEDVRWSPAYPVIATNTWEWAANSGRTSTLVLGG
jgi:hypothetical protein